MPTTCTSTWMRTRHFGTHRDCGQFISISFCNIFFIGKVVDCMNVEPTTKKFSLHKIGFCFRIYPCICFWAAAISHLELVACLTFYRTAFIVFLNGTTASRIVCRICCFCSIRLLPHGILWNFRLTWKYRTKPITTAINNECPVSPHIVLMSIKRRARTNINTWNAVNAPATYHYHNILGIAMFFMLHFLCERLKESRLLLPGIDGSTTPLCTITSAFGHFHANNIK